MNTESTSTPWVRQKQVPFPSVWLRFKGRKEINGVLPSFWVQDIPEDEFENVVNCMIERFCVDAPLPKYSCLLQDLESVNSMRKLWRYVLRHKIGLICYMENPEPNGNPIFVGVNCTYIKSTCDQELKFSGKAFEQILGTIKLMTDHADVFNFLGTNTLLTSLGLFVLPEYRGQGIGLELLLARKQMCKALGIKAAVTIFSSIFSQRLAEEAGYKSIYEISYRDLRDIYKYDYPGVEEKHRSVKCLLQDLESVNSVRKLFRDALRDKTGLICYMENPEPNRNPIFVGVNCTHIKSTCDEKLKLPGKALEQVFRTIKLVTDHADVFNFLGTNTLLSGKGLYVLPEYREQGIGFEILLARKQMCKALGIKAAVTLFTSSFAQRLAEKAGYKSLYEISFRDLRDIHKHDYHGVEENHEFIKYMYIEYL